MVTAVGLCDEHSLVHPDLSLQPGAGILGVPLSEEASHFSAHRCVFCQVLAVSHLVFEVDVRPHLGADSASTERRQCRPSAEGPRWRIVRRQYPRLKSEVEVCDCISTSIEKRFCANRALAECLGDEGPLWRQFGDWVF